MPSGKHGRSLSVYKEAAPLVIGGAKLATKLPAPEVLAYWALFS